MVAGMLRHLTYLRSESIFGLSFVIMIFDDSSVNDWNRQKVLERLTQVSIPQGLSPQIGTDWSTTGQIYWYTLRSSNPRYDLMELRSLEDWVLQKQFKSVPDVVDVSDFGGVEREYQVRVDPDKLVSYGLSIGQVEQQLSNNNINAGGGFAWKPGPAANERPRHSDCLPTSTTSRKPCSRRNPGRRCASGISPTSPRDRRFAWAIWRGRIIWKTGASSMSRTSFKALFTCVKGPKSNPHWTRFTRRSTN